MEWIWVIRGVTNQNLVIKFTERLINLDVTKTYVVNQNIMEKLDFFSTINVMFALEFP